MSQRARACGELRVASGVECHQRMASRAGARLPLVIAVAIVSALPCHALAQQRAQQRAQPAHPHGKQAQPKQPPTRSLKGPLQMTGPVSLLLGKDGAVEVSLKNVDTPLKIVASAGSLSLPVLRDGRLVATYTPPPTRFPQVAVIAAYNQDRSVIDFLGIPLHGQPTLRIDSEPKAQVEVHLAGSIFGPIKLDRKGSGRIEIIVPPGFASATLVSSDALGNQKQEAQELGVPHLQQVFGICPSGGDDLLVLAFDAQGNPLRDARFELSASIGTLSSTAERQPGVYSTRFRVDTPAAQASSTLSVNLKDSPAPAVFCQAELPPEAPDRIDVALDRSTFVAGEATPIEVHIDLHYPGMRLPRKVQPVLTSDIGELSDVETLSETSFVARWTPGTKVSENAEAQVSATIVDTKLEARATLRLAPGPVAKLVLRSSDTRVRANQEDTAIITLRAFDAFGNSTSPGALVVDASQGSLQALPAAEDGPVRYQYIGPFRRSDGSDQITARAVDGPSSSLTIDLDATPSRFVGSARLGVANHFAKSTDLALAADASFRVPLGRQSLALGMETGYFANRQTQSDEVSGLSVDSKFRSLAIMARAVYEFHWPVQVYGGGAMGASFSAFTTSSSASGMVTESATRPAFGGILGARKSVGPALIVLEAGYFYSRFDEANLQATARGPRLTAGLGLDL